MLPNLLSNPSYLEQFIAFNQDIADQKQKETLRKFRLQQEVNGATMAVVSFGIPGSSLRQESGGSVKRGTRGGRNPRR